MSKSGFSSLLLVTWGRAHVAMAWVGIEQLKLEKCNGPVGCCFVQSWWNWWWNWSWLQCAVDVSATTFDWANQTQGDRGCAWVCPDSVGRAGGGEPRVSDGDGENTRSLGIWQPRRVSLRRSAQHDAAAKGRLVSFHILLFALCVVSLHDAGFAHLPVKTSLCLCQSVSACHGILFWAATIPRVTRVAQLQKIIK